MGSEDKTFTTREKVLAAALQLFSAKGYLGATTKEIAKLAGIAEVTLFRQFSSKEQLFEEVLNTYSFLPKIKSLIPEIEKLPYEEALALIAMRFLETLKSRIEMIRIMQSEMSRYPEKIHKIYNSFLDGIIKTLALYFKSLQDAGALKEFNTEYAARAFMGMFYSFFSAQEILLGKKYRKADLELVVKEYVNIFAGGTVKK
ncbi:MAG: TetR/AcrR family transcriptional regulator [Nitrospirae bacterium]|nr:TetR/AcrR family transcriptional regulator [Nitrospirota bacterium]